jgi:competence ComEA-like helix-hairpin-helix protein
MSRWYKLSISFVAGIVLVVPTAALALVNINTATLEELDTLYGIGVAKAEDIIAYREGPDGSFESIEEIMNVSGIGEATFNKIKDSITVAGATTLPEPSEAPAPEHSEEVASPPTPSGSGSVALHDETFITVDAGSDRTVFVGADSEFRAFVTGFTGDVIPNARVVWSFGNGERKEGQSVLHHFLYPGEYVVVVDASNEVYSATDRIIVRAIPALLEITQVTNDYIGLKNNTGTEVDIGGWLLFSLGKQFQFPQHTVLLSHQEVFISNKRTGLSGADPSTVVLQYPNGMVATSFTYPLFISANRNAEPRAQSVSPVDQDGTQPPSAGSEDIVSIHPTQLVTAPVVATQDTQFGMIPWILGVIILAGCAGGGVLYIRNKKEPYAIEEIS